MLRAASTLFALVVVAASPAHADLYRWVDPDSGSVRLSSLPPTDARVSAELVPYRGAPLPNRPAQSAPRATDEAATVPALEAQLRQLTSQLAGATPQDLAKGSETVRQQLYSYEALRAQLDRLDPAGAQRRAAEATRLIAHLRK